MAGKFGDFLKDIEGSEFAKGGGFEIVGGVAADAVGALTSKSKYKGAQTGKAIGGGVGAAAGAIIGGPMGAKVGQALGGLAGGLIGGASDQKNMINDYEQVNYRKYSKLNLSANQDPYGSDNTFYMEDGGVVTDGEDPIAAARNAGTKAGQALIGLSTTGRTKTKKKSWSDDELFDFKDSGGIKTGRYPKQHLKGIIAAAQAVGEDPYEAAAFVLQESSMGMAGDRNLGYTYQDLSEQQVKEMTELSTKTGIESRYLEPLIVYRDKMKYAKSLGYTDRAKQIQVYNGMGVLTKKMANADKAYGVPIGDGIDMRKNPIYGKRVLALANDMKRNPYIKTLLASGAVASMEDGGVVGEPPTGRKATAAELASVKADAQSFVRRRPGQFLVAPEDIHTGGEVPLVTLNGKQIPYGAPVLEPNKAYAKAPRGVTEFQYDGTNAWFTDPQTGDLRDMDPADINLPQFRKAAKMADGGQVEGEAMEPPQKQMVNIELGELLINPESLEIVRKYDNKNRYKPHARKHFNEAMGNFTLIPEGMVVIPKKHAEAFEKGDNLSRKSIVASILKDQAKRPETRMPHMKLGGEVGGPGDDLPFVDSLDGMIETAITQHQLFTPGRGGTQNMEYPYPNRPVPAVEVPNYGANMIEDITAYNTPAARRVSSITVGEDAPVDLKAGLATRNAAAVDIDTDTSTDDELQGGGTNWAQKLSKAAMGLPTAMGVMNALGRDPYLRYDENTQYDTAKAYVQNSPTDVNIEASKAAIRRRAANTNRALLNVNSPAVRAEIAANNADRLSAEGDLVQNAVNLSTQARQRKSESLARLEEAQGTSRLNMRQKFQEELRQDAANRRMMLQAGVSEGVTNYRKAVVEDEKIRAINTMARYNKLDPNSKNLLVDTQLFGEDALDYIITRSGNGLTAGKTGNSGVVKTTTDGKGRVKSKTVTTKG